VDYHDWKKLHLLVGTKTHTIVAAVPTIGTANDSPQFRALIEAAPMEFDIQGLSADKEYLSAENLNLVGTRGGIPYIPFKRNSVTSGSKPLLWQLTYHLFALKRPQFLERYHRRSNVESVMMMLKAKQGHFLRSKSDAAQMNELLAKVVCHNICVLIKESYRHGIDPKLGEEQAVRSA
jgi:transposase